MGIEVIDGMIEAAVVKKSTAKVTLFDSITIRASDGSQRRLDKVAAAPEVAAALQPGTDGRFYAYKAIDHRGVFGLRTRDGRSAFAPPTGNERIMLVAAIAGLVGLFVLLALGKGIGLLAVIVGAVGAIGYFKYRSDRIGARARFDSDTEYTSGFA
ncbi:MAG TPA: hypothetical protein VF645_00670 [Allosphingosinicella sp.]|jgi:hypothetical protein